MRADSSPSPCGPFLRREDVSQFPADCRQDSRLSEDLRSRRNFDFNARAGGRGAERRCAQMDALVRLCAQKRRVGSGRRGCSPRIMPPPGPAAHGGSGRL
ncbi:hypothetical protein FQA47_009084 [Oryzias melastigma]|uniref:Uncharacterized protein n=1 Tax=Oryzias melastigma TaxID=30732 RepID=A0A834C527_ORYME|nr:hypothetical protein FQA47_009084 [Oryzias melastigma]